MIDADKFIEIAKNPVNWLDKSQVLRQSADQLWDTFIVSCFDQAGANRDGDQGSLENAVNFLIVAQMLYGLALETAMKGKLLQTQPSSIEFKPTGDETGAIQSVEIKRLGVSLNTGHNLVILAELTGLIKTDDNRIEREILRYLSECILWRVRYPIPKKSSSIKPIPEDVPSVAFGHYIRDWIDPWLDKLLGTPPLDPLEYISRFLKKEDHK